MKVLAVNYKYNIIINILHPIKVKIIINIHTILLNNNNNILCTLNINKLYYITLYNKNINENSLSKYIIYN